MQHPKCERIDRRDASVSERTEKEVLVLTFQVCIHKRVMSYRLHLLCSLFMTHWNSLRVWSCFNITLVLLYTVELVSDFIADKIVSIHSIAADFAADGLNTLVVSDGTTVLYARQLWSISLLQWERERVAPHDESQQHTCQLHARLLLQSRSLAQSNISCGRSIWNDVRKSI